MSNAPATVWMHADDYGISLAQSRRILDCSNRGALNSVSVMTNVAGFETSMRLLLENPRFAHIRRVVHLNLVEGLPAAKPTDVADLIDANGHLCCSFSGLMRMGLSSRKEAYRRQIANEIRAQIARFTAMTGSKTVSIDSHRHVHMIPVVLDALTDVVREEHLTVEWLRVSADPITPILTTPSLWGKINPVNLVKWALLKILSPSPAKLDSLACRVPVFFGMFFTCEMALEPVARLLPKYEAIARKEGRALELMFHPGKVENPEELPDGARSAFRDFYESSWRDREAQALRNLSCNRN